MTKAAYCDKELSLALQKKGIEAHRVMRFEKGGGWYWQYTFDIICRWLREEHNIHIYAFFAETWNYEIQKLEEDWTYSKFGCKTYDEAITNAIWYTINNLI